MDDIDLSGIGMPIFLDDINQIDIFQGPQSYAYGHNAMAGLIHVKTQDPTLTEHNKINAVLGNDKLFKLSLHNNFKPILNNKLAMNQFTYYSQQNGFQSVYDFNPRNPYGLNIMSRGNSVIITSWTTGGGPSDRIVTDIFRPDGTTDSNYISVEGNPNSPSVITKDYQGNIKDLKFFKIVHTIPRDLQE